MKLTVYYNDQNAPQPNQPLLPGACAIIVNEEEKILLIKRNDSPLWSLPGGTMELGESIGQCCLREVKEEVGIKATVEKLVGIYTSPECVFAWSNGKENKVWQSFVIAFLLRTKNKKVKLNQESVDYQWLYHKDIEKLHTFPFVKDIIAQALNAHHTCFFD